MSVDPKVIYEIWEMCPGGAALSTYEIVASLLRGRQTYSQYDPEWIIVGNITGHGVVRLGRLRCEGRGRTYATVVLAAYALGEACPLPLAALASRLLAEGRAQPVEDCGFGRRG